MISAPPPPRAATSRKQLLAAARQQVLQPQIVNLNDVVSSTMRLLSSSLGENIHIRTHVDEHLWTTYADAGKLHQVLLNLAINAREAMPKGGALTVETRNVRVDEAYARQRPHLHVGGLRAAHRQRHRRRHSAGDPRQDLRSLLLDARTRLGLGLAVVHGIIDQTGGQIWLYSEVGQGTTFKILFPRVSGTIVAPEEIKDDWPDLAARGTESILVVEDELLVRTILRETLEEQGYQVIEASRETEAVALAKDSSLTIDLLLTDVVLPDSNGRSLAESVQTIRPGLPVIYMSGYTDNAISNHGVLQPGVRFLEKPVPTAVLLRAIRGALDAPPPVAV